jgi:meso-butanediol dehydrogenase / (S,S)-butanediol dehydrogenase / diacetyl reductase
VSIGIVVGASGGIGGACARALADCAERMVVCGRRREPLRELADELGATAVPVVADVATADGRKAVAAAVTGPLAWVVLAHGLPLRKPLAELQGPEIEELFAANLVGPALLLNHLLRLEWAEPKAIVAIGSISASRALPRRAVYGASKAGIEHLARSLAAELGPAGFRVNIVAPGVIGTPFLGDDTERLADWIADRVPTGRIGAPEDVAEVVRFLIADAPAYLTGARIAVDGGAETVG